MPHILIGYQTRKTTSPAGTTKNAVGRHTMCGLSSSVKFISSWSTKQTTINSWVKKLKMLCTWFDVLFNNMSCHVNPSDRIIYRYFTKLMNLIVKMHTLPCQTTVDQKEKNDKNYIYVPSKYCFISCFLVFMQDHRSVGEYIKHGKIHSLLTLANKCA